MSLNITKDISYMNDFDGFIVVKLCNYGSNYEEIQLMFGDGTLTNIPFNPYCMLPLNH